MSGPKVIWYLLANDVQLTANVPAGRIKSGILPLNTPLPAISVEEVSLIERNTTSMAEAIRFSISRVQVTVYAKTYSQKKAVLDLVRKACDNTFGQTINGVTVDSVLAEGAGPDMDDNETEIYMQSRDFMVKFQAST